MKRVFGQLVPFQLSKRLLFSCLLIVLSHRLAVSQNQGDSGNYKTIHVKFKEHLKPARAIAGKAASSGVYKVDQISEKHKALYIKRIFPHAGVFEEAHRAYGLHLWYEIKFEGSVNLNNAINEYRSTDSFEDVEERKPYTSTYDRTESINISTLPSGTNDPLFNQQWHFANTGQIGGTPGADINLLQAWQIETGSPNVIVAVIDEGINVNHPDLKNALWINSDEIPGNGLDDDHNGYPDDIHGYGFGDGSATIYPGNHGTHVAGTIGAISNNGIGVSGIAGGNGVSGGVRLMSCAGFGNFEIGGFEEAMVYAADNGAVISQNSWGGGSSAIEAAIDYFVARAGYDNSSENFDKNIQTGPIAGGIVVFAAGNYNSNSAIYGYPASYDNVIAVASTDASDVKSEFSNFGAWVDISAPGTSVFSTHGNSYGYLSGTSMACPHVSGVAALIISNLQGLGLKPNQVWNRLRLSSKSLDAKNPLMPGQLGWGRVDAYAALKEPDAIPPGPILDVSIKEILSTSLLLEWTASGENHDEGQAAEYEVRYSTNPINETNFSAASLLIGAPAPPLSGKKVVFNVVNLSSLTTYYFALRSIDVFNNKSSLSNVVSATTLRIPMPERITEEVTEQLYTGGTSTRQILIKNVSDGAPLLVRVGSPKLQTAPVIPPPGAKGRLFAINSFHSTIEELNVKSGQVVRSIPMPEASSRTREGLAFDGTHLYYGSAKKVYKMNAETGAVIRVIEVPKAEAINGLAWSGRYLYVATKELYGWNVIYEVDSDDGTILRTLNHVYNELAYRSTSNTLLSVNGGGIEEINMETGDRIREISIGWNPKAIAFSSVENLVFVSDNSNAFIRAIRPDNGAVMYSMSYPVTTAIAGDEHKPGWLSTTDEIVTIPPGQTAGVPITFNSAGLNAGTWTGSVKIIPINSSVAPWQVPITMNVLTGTDIETIKEIDFGTAFAGFSVDTTIIVENRGFSELVISQIQSNDIRLTSSISSATLQPGQKINMQVSVESSGVGSINAQLTLTSNDPDEGTLTIPVSANILAAPGISVSPGSLTTTLATGEQATLALTLTNTGASALHWNANLAGTDGTAIEPLAVQQDGYPVQPDSIYKNEIGEVTLKSSSPETVTCLAYVPESGLVYARGISSNAFYTYDPMSDQWNNIGLIPSTFHGQASHLNGKIYYGGTQLNIYSIQSNSWASIAFPTAGTAVSITNDDKYVYVAIGKILYRYDPTTEDWLTLAPAPGTAFVTGFSALSYHAGIIYAPGTLAIIGDGNTPFYKYLINSDEWIRSTSIPGKLTLGGAIDVSSARFFVLGSPASAPGQGIQISILDIATSEWTSLATPFSLSSITAMVFVGKENVSGVYFTQGEVGTKFGYYETASAPNWFETVPASGTLPPGEIQTITVKLSAQGLFGGEYLGNVRVYSTKPSIEANIPLKLTVTGEPSVSLSKLSADVGKVVIDYGLASQLSIRNKGTAPLVVDSISISSPDFTIDKSTFTVHIGEAIYALASFVPTSAGYQTCTFTFHSAHGDFQFVLSGTGVHPAELVVPTDTVRATLLTGATVKKIITIGNIGDGSTLNLRVQGNTSWINFDSSQYIVNINAHQEREFEANISAPGLSQGFHDGSILVQDFSDPTRVSYEIPVRITVIAAPQLYVSTDIINFETKFVNNTYDNNIEIKNSGVLPLSINSIASDNPAFTISVGSPLTLNPGQSVQATVRFSPTTVSSQLGAITITSNDPDEGVMNIKLKGDAVIAPQLTFSDTELHVSGYTSQSTAESIVMFNQGGSILKWKIREQSNPYPSAEGDFTSKAPTPFNPFSSEPLLGLTTDPTSGVLYAHDFWSQSLYSYDPQLDKWTDIGNTLYPEYDFQHGGAVVLNSKMYCTYLEGATSIYIYDMMLKNWSKKINKLGHGTATLTTDGTLLYFAGGGKFKSYNPKTDVWVELPIPNFTLNGKGGLSYLEGIIYAHSSDINAFAKYTIATGIWETLPPIPLAGAQGSTIDPIKKRYYVYAKNYLFEYDIATSTWTTVEFSLFEVGGSGGIAFTPKSGYAGIYFLQGNSGKGFARYEQNTKLGWLRTSQLIGEIESTENQTIGINCNAANLTRGVYHGMIQVTSNDPNLLTRDIPVTFEVRNIVPTIEVPSLITGMVERENLSTRYLVIRNDGKEVLNWNLAKALPSWLSVDKTEGNISGHNVDSIKIVFSAGLFVEPKVVADYTFEINSNDPATAITSTRLALTIPNKAPILKVSITDQQMISGQSEIQLLEHFTDPDDDPLDFSVYLSNNDFVTATIVDSKLVINPLKNGLVTVTLKATDFYGSSISTIFNVNNLVTGIEQERVAMGFSASPNPFDDKIKIHFGEHELGKATLVLFDFTGKAVWRSQEINLSSQQEFYIDATSFPAGLYVCVLMIDNKIVNSIRILKHH